MKQITIYDLLPLLKKGWVACDGNGWAWKLNRYGDKIWEQLSQETKDRWFYLINKPYRKALKKRGIK